MLVQTYVDTNDINHHVQVITIACLHTTIYTYTYSFSFHTLIISSPRLCSNDSGGFQ